MVLASPTIDQDTKRLGDVKKARRLRVKVKRYSRFERDAVSACCTVMREEQMRTIDPPEELTPSTGSAASFSHGHGSDRLLQ